MKMKNLHSIPFHHYLISLFPVLVIYSRNKDITYFQDTIIPILFSISISILLFYILNFFEKNVHRNALITSLCIIIIFAYGHFYEIIVSYLPSLAPHKLFIIPYLSISVIFCFKLIKKHRNNFENFTPMLNFVSSVLLIINLINIVTYQFKTVTNLKTFNDDEIIDYSIKANNQIDNPDIYFIVLDSYLGKSVLKNEYNFDNEPFIKKLEQRKFIIANNGHSNFPFTGTSLGSTLNLNYINEIKDGTTITRDYLYQIIKNNYVLNFIKKRGYRYIHFNTGYSIMSKNKYADINIGEEGIFGSEFIRIFFQTSIFNPFAKRIEKYIQGN